MKRLKARCSREDPFGSISWQARFDACPRVLSFSSTRMQGSDNSASCTGSSFALLATPLWKASAYGCLKAFMLPSAFELHAALVPTLAPMLGNILVPILPPMFTPNPNPLLIVVDLKLHQNVIKWGLQSLVCYYYSTKQYTIIMNEWPMVIIVMTTDWSKIIDQYLTTGCNEKNESHFYIFE